MRCHMNSEFISEIQKYIEYRDEPQRVMSYTGGVIFIGDHHRHCLIYDPRSGKWICECKSYKTWGACSHSLAVAYLDRTGQLPKSVALPLAA